MPSRDRVEPQFVAERKIVSASDEVLVAKRKSEMVGEILPPEDSVPNVFDEARIRADLERLSAAPTLFARYFVVLSSRFQRKNEIAVLDRWKELYVKSKELADAIRSLHTTQHEQAVRVSELEAQAEENRLRRDRAKAERRRINESRAQELPKKSLDEVQFERKQSLRLLDLQDQIFEDLELKVKSDIDITKAKKKCRRQIMNDPNLTEQEQDDLLDRLDKRFDTLTKGKDISIFS
ncbi:MAG: hypothetical protein H0U76_10380 [Ktedonobacteraceae bacterium]|nr:hypothetical protein [Ktedonobacteraceae bacterium]